MLNKLRELGLHISLKGNHIVVASKEVKAKKPEIAKFEEAVKKLKDKGYTTASWLDLPASRLMEVQRKIKEYLHESAKDIEVMFDPQDKQIVFINKNKADLFKLNNFLMDVYDSSTRGNALPLDEII